jgi:5-methylcytosine-specific restriction endonuclease McrA
MLYMSLTRAEQRDLIDSHIRSSELPLAGWESMRDVRRDSLPSRQKIIDCWADTLQLIDRFDSKFEIEEGACWACGFYYGGSALARCHILSWQQGGSWSETNLHLLCDMCHKMSENLWGEDYWVWFAGGAKIFSPHRKYFEDRAKGLDRGATPTLEEVLPDEPDCIRDLIIEERKKP